MSFCSANIQSLFVRTSCRHLHFCRAYVHHILKCLLMQGTLSFLSSTFSVWLSILGLCYTIVFVILCKAFMPID
jgi:hypothetical protein